MRIKKLMILSGMLVLVVGVMLFQATPALATMPSTFLTMSASAMEVVAESPVTLTIEELNDGSRALTDPYVELTYDTTVMILDKSSGSFAGGDTNNNDVLDVGENWIWQPSFVISADTHFVAIGHGIFVYSGTVYDITYPLDQQEKAELTVTVTENGGGQGDTPGYWRNHYEDWAPSGYSPGDDFDTAFGVDWFDPDITMDDAVWMKGGGVNALTRHAAAALLNAAHPDVNYDLTLGEVISYVQAVDLTDNQAVKNLKDLFEGYNEQGR